MADLSNRALALLLVVAIVTSITGTTWTLSRLQGTGGPSGFVLLNDSGQTDFSIDANFSIKFVNNAIHFGSGSVQGGGACDMGTNNSPPTLDANCFGFNDTVHEMNLTIENDGNIRANISLNFSQNASQAIGGSLTPPHLKYRVYNEEPGSCATFGNGSSFQEVGNSSQEVSIKGMRVCTNLDFADANDLIGIGLWMSLPEDAPATGQRTIDIYALGCDDDSC